MRVLIAGGLGYLGGRIAQHLLKIEHQIVIGSRNASTAPDWLPQTEVAQIDWQDGHALEQICNGFDVVIHAAGMNAQASAANPVAALEFNGLATARLVAAASRAGVKRFIYLSTAHVYATPLIGSITEDTCPRNVHPYATSHRAGEDLVRAAHQCGEIEGVVIRLSNAFGAPAYKDANCWMLLANDLCRQAVTTQRMVLHSSGLQRRDFVPLSDVCCAIEHLLRLPTRDLGNGIFNMGGRWSPTVWELSCLVQVRCQEMLGFEPNLIRVLPQLKETTDNLEYRLDALSKTGFQVSADKAGELDQLLDFCRHSFA